MAGPERGLKSSSREKWPGLAPAPTNHHDARGEEQAVMPPPTFFARVAYTPRVASPVAVTVNGSRPGPLTVVVPAAGMSSGVPSALTVPWSTPGSRPTTLVESTSLAGQTTWRWSGLAVSSASWRTTAGVVAAAGHGQPGAGRDDQQHQQDGRDPARPRRAEIVGRPTGSGGGHDRSCRVGSASTMQATIATS